MKTYYEKGRRLPVCTSVDVLVAGGGVSGFSAAVAAARNGARTLLVERNGVLGGVATAGLMISWGVRGKFFDHQGRQVLTGIPWELHQRIIAYGGGEDAALKFETAAMKMCYDLEIFKRVVMEMLVEAGVEILYHTFVCDVIMDGAHVKGVIIESKSGRQAVYAHQTVDATGDADVCAMAGAECVGPTGSTTDFSDIHSNMIRIGGVDKHRACQAVEERKHLIEENFRDTEYSDDLYSWEGLKRQWQSGFFLIDIPLFRAECHEAIDQGLIQEEQLSWYSDSIKGENKGEFGYDMQGVEGRMTSDIVDVWGVVSRFDGTDATQLSRAHTIGYQMVWPFFEHILKKIPGFERAYILNIASDFGVRASRRVTTRYALSYAEGTQEAAFDDSMGMVARMAWWKKKYWEKPYGAFQIPYRQILPVDLEDVYIVGKPHYKSGLRGMPQCMVMSEGAGTAAALAAKHGVASSAVDIQELQQTLAANNVRIRWEDES